MARVSVVTESRSLATAGVEQRGTVQSVEVEEQ